ncbi:predicted protein [Verticillium alfalfae VaMs.102]|uniref:Predicted protein n=1 Tax=Verticillium alfalfae (strain VaMs.102 / ATCC MYA-4576 / FGSC 10136) TaxID=526221 RepID=C9SQ41_VERA1|nr:predicted protein [Verticillium alfalfae VaMs.102]EEY20966.1 predicted protein [Verticillium alfalfae VaMs.102]
MDEARRRCTRQQREAVARLGGRGETDAGAQVHEQEGNAIGELAEREGKDAELQAGPGGRKRGGKGDDAPQEGGDGLGAGAGAELETRLHQHEDGLSEQLDDGGGTIDAEGQDEVDDGLMDGGAGAGSRGGSGAGMATRRLYRAIEEDGKVVDLELGRQAEERGGQITQEELVGEKGEGARGDLQGDEQRGAMNGSRLGASTSRYVGCCARSICRR